MSGVGFTGNDLAFIALLKTVSFLFLSDYGYVAKAKHGTDYEGTIADGDGVHIAGQGGRRRFGVVRPAHG
ncbi:hypothetical protein, partial [Nocardia nova]|uniref:hypothetical protein n=1 Tax=Nocardia nova TaxID=37330 RepID=UPI001E5C5EBD